MEGMLLLSGCNSLYNIQGGYRYLFAHRITKEEKERIGQGESQNVIKYLTLARVYVL